MSEKQLAKIEQLLDEICVLAVSPPVKRQWISSIAFERQRPTR
jgi:hypothetical protein